MRTWKLHQNVNKIFNPNPSLLNRLFEEHNNKTIYVNICQNAIISIFIFKSILIKSYALFFLPPNISNICQDQTKWHNNQFWLTKNEHMDQIFLHRMHNCLRSEVNW